MNDPADVIETETTIEVLSETLAEALELAVEDIPLQTETTIVES